MDFFHDFLKLKQWNKCYSRKKYFSAWDVTYQFCGVPYSKRRKHIVTHHWIKVKNKILPLPGKNSFITFHFNNLRNFDSPIIEILLLKLCDVLNKSLVSFENFLRLIRTLYPKCKKKIIYSLNYYVLDQNFKSIFSGNVTIYVVWLYYIYIMETTLTWEGEVESPHSFDLKFIGLR